MIEYSQLKILTFDDMFQISLVLKNYVIKNFVYVYKNKSNISECISNC